MYIYLCSTIHRHYVIVCGIISTQKTKKHSTWVFDILTGKDFILSDDVLALHYYPSCDIINNL